MALARWKDLVVDAESPERLGAFWAGALGLSLEPLDDGVGEVRLAAEGEPGRTVWVNAVPEPRTVKHRVHLDVRGELDDLLALGARVLREPNDDDHWTVLADPEGGELCLFPTTPDKPAGLYEMVVDSVDAVAQARWWADVLGATFGADEVQPWAWVEDVAGAPFDYLVFTPVPEPKTVKNRWHWDVVADSVDPFVERGARVLRTPDADDVWHVLADPEGNEFCVFEPALRSGG